MQGCTCILGCPGNINSSKIAPDYFVGFCSCESEFKALGAFNWTASFTAALSVVVVAGGGGGGSSPNFGTSGAGGGGGTYYQGKGGNGGSGFVLFKYIA